MNILGLIGSIFKPAVELIDSLHTSEEEKLAHKARTLDSYVDAIELGLTYETDALKQKAEVIKAEANSKFRIAAIWRPLTMLGFLAVIMNNYVLAPYIELFFDVTVPVLEIGPEMWGLLKVGIGGYIASRGVEKVVPSIVGALKKRDET